MSGSKEGGFDRHAPPLATLYERGRAAHPDVDLDNATFVAHLTRCGANLAGGTGAVHAEDLFLACAALRGNKAAVEGLRRTLRSVLAGYLRPIDTSVAFLDEVEQLLWDTMLVGDARRPAKLASYSGKGELAGFIGIAAQRLALNTVRQRAAEARVAAGAAGRPQSPVVDVEIAFLKQQYRDAFQEAIREGLAVLGDRERMIFRLHVVDRLTVEQIAQMYGVSQSTISRWLAGAREQVITKARGLLRERLQLSESEFESIARLLISQLDVSVSSVLADRR